MADMAMIYAQLIMAGRKTLEDVPMKDRDAVKRTLIELEPGLLAEAE
jgi:hypothetical protein